MEKNSSKTLLNKKYIYLLMLCLLIISCGTKVGLDDIEITEENGLTMGYLKSDNSFDTVDIFDYYGLNINYKIFYYDRIYSNKTNF